MYWVLAGVALSFLIVVHEGGHYFVARWCGMRVERFSIGFGPGILKRQSKKTGTIFQIAPIPFGGFVEIRGMNIAEDVDPDDRFAYPNRPAWQRFVTIFAGPATNYASAVLLAIGLYSCHGADVPHWFGVHAVMPESASVGKLEPGDRIVAVDHVPLYADSGPGLSERVNDGKGAPVTLTIERKGGTSTDVVIQPKLEKTDDGKPTWRIGVQPEQQFVVVPLGVVDAVGAALVFPVHQTEAILGGLYDIITGAQKADPGGPKRIFDEFHKAFEAGIVPGIKLLMMLSVYLGLFNLLPLPALDGGRLVFLAYELITRRRANPKIEATVHMGGIMVLGIAMVLVTLHDCHLY